MKLLCLMFLVVAMVAASPRIQRRSSEPFSSPRHFDMPEISLKKRFILKTHSERRIKPDVDKERHLPASETAVPWSIDQVLKRFNRFHDEFTGDYTGSGSTMNSPDAYGTGSGSTMNWPDPNYTDSGSTMNWTDPYDTGSGSTMNWPDANYTDAGSTMNSTDANNTDEYWKSGMSEFTLLVAKCEHMTYMLEQIPTIRRIKAKPPKWVSLYETVCGNVTTFVMGDYLFYLMIEAQDQLRHEFSKYYEVIRCYNLKFPGMAHTGHFLSSLLSMISDENPHTFWCESIPEDYVGFQEFLGRRLVPTK